MLEGSVPVEGAVLGLAEGTPLLTSGDEDTSVLVAGPGVLAAVLDEGLGAMLPAPPTLDAALEVPVTGGLLPEPSGVSEEQATAKATPAANVEGTTRIQFINNSRSQ
jgi:hypothetical protein